MGHPLRMPLQLCGVLPALYSPGEVEEVMMAISIRPYCSTRNEATELPLAPAMLLRTGSPSRCSASAHVNGACLHCTGVCRWQRPPLAEERRVAGR